MFLIPTIRISSLGSHSEMDSDVMQNLCDYYKLVKDIDEELLSARLQALARNVLPADVADELGVGGIEEAVVRGILGPPDCVQHLVTSNSLFSDRRDLFYEQGEVLDDSCVDTLHPAAVYLQEMIQRLLSQTDKFIFDSGWAQIASLTCLILARYIFHVDKIPQIVKFPTFCASLLSVCASTCAVRNTIDGESFGKVVNKVLVIALVLLLFPVVPFIPLPGTLRAGLTPLAALGTMYTSYFEPYINRVGCQYLVMFVVVLSDGFIPSQNGPGTGTCASGSSFAPPPALTLFLCMIFSCLISETLKYTKRKAYSSGR